MAYLDTSSICEEMFLLLLSEHKISYDVYARSDLIGNLKVAQNWKNKMLRKTKMKRRNDDGNEVDDEGPPNELQVGISVHQDVELQEKSLHHQSVRQRRICLRVVASWPWFVGACGPRTMTPPGSIWSLQK